MGDVDDDDDMDEDDDDDTSQYLHPGPSVACSDAVRQSPDGGQLATTTLGHDERPQVDVRPQGRPPPEMAAQHCEGSLHVFFFFFFFLNIFI